jgi:hypothetical protein
MNRRQFLERSAVAAAAFAAPAACAVETSAPVRHPRVVFTKFLEGCFRDRAARPEGRTTPPTDPDERN